MSRKKVLIEGYNLTLEAGTGIATYARTLAASVKALGHDTEVLVGTRRAVGGRDRLLSEVELYDASPFAPKARISPMSLAMQGWRMLAGFPLGMRPGFVELGGTVVPPTSGFMSGFARASIDRVYAAFELQNVTRSHFKRWRGRVDLKLESRPDLFHATQPIPVRVDKCPNIYTIHDLVPLRLPYTTLDDKKYFLDLCRHLARTADHIVTVSECSRRDIIELLKIPEYRVTNTYQSVHLPEHLLSIPADDLARELEHSFQLEPGGYFLFVGAFEPKKNIARLLDAYASAGSRRPLVIVGTPGWLHERDMEKMQDERFLSYRVSGATITPRRKVRKLSYLPLQQLVALMRGARAVLFPSLYEGFGLPVLEAMVAGAPVLTSNVSSLPEVAGDAALLVDPNDVGSIAEGIRKLDRDDDLVAELVRRGREKAKEFSPERYRERLAKLYRKVM